MIIENKALGYLLQYHLTDFESGKKSVKFAGFTRFEELKPCNNSERQYWEKERQRAYYGSLQHFLSALAQDRGEAEGYLLRFVSEPDPSADARIVINAHVKTEQLITQGELPNERKLSFANFLEVYYIREEPESGYWRFMRMKRLGTHLARGEADVRNQISLAEMSAPVVVINTGGYMSNPFALTTYGYWSYERVADMLPLDYKPKKE
ncbi:MAG: hypothetical protein HY089_13455 [Ignavibacteriales bacterium]|nr:hypothetical protein [Ignavibacteriales bacterium]